MSTNHPRWRALVEKVIAPQVQAIEDVIQQLILISRIDVSVGVQLDVIGRLVGQSRQGMTDVMYRKYLKARILLNKCGGTLEQIYGVFRSIFSGTFTFSTNYPAGILFGITDIVTALEDKVLINFLGKAVSAGVSAILFTKQQTDANCFWTATASCLTVGAFIGDPLLQVDGTYGLTTGAATINPGLADEESVTITSVIPPNEFHCSTLAANHAIGSAVVQASVGKGCGWADALSSPASVGATTLTVYSVSGFPTSGSLVLDGGTAWEEVVTYSSVSAMPAQFLGVSPTVHAHALKSEVQAAAIGGKLVSAATA